MSRLRRSLGVVVLTALAAGCAVAPTPSPGDLADKGALKRLQEPNQQRNVYFLSEGSLFPRSREVLLSDKPIVVANALLSQLQRGPVVRDDGEGVSSDYLPNWEFRALQVDDDKTLSIDVSTGADVAEKPEALCQILYTLIDDRTIRGVRLFDGVRPITVYRNTNFEAVEATDPITKAPCSTLDRDQRSVRLLFVKDGRLKYVERAITGVTSSSEPLEWTDTLIQSLVPTPKETAEGFTSDAASVSPELRSETDSQGREGFVFSLSAAFDRLSETRRALVLAQLLAAIEQVPNKSFGAVAIEVGGVRKAKVPGPGGFVNTPIQLNQYRSLFPAGSITPTTEPVDTVPDTSTA